MSARDLLASVDTAYKLASDKRLASADVFQAVASARDLARPLSAEYEALLDCADALAFAQINQSGMTGPCPVCAWIVADEGHEIKCVVGKALARLDAVRGGPK